MALKLSNHYFSGENTIVQIDFLTRFVGEDNIQKISKSQILIALSSFLKYLQDASTRQVLS